MNRELNASYLKFKDGIVPQTLWTYDEVGHTQEAKKELVEICDFDSSGDVFVTPKPTRLIERILEIATDPGDLVLDSFAGTRHHRARRPQEKRWPTATTAGSFWWRWRRRSPKTLRCSGSGGRWRAIRTKGPKKPC